LSLKTDHGLGPNFEPWNDHNLGFRVENGALSVGLQEGPEVEAVVLLWSSCGPKLTSLFV